METANARRITKRMGTIVNKREIRMNHSRKRRRIMANAKGIPKGLDKRLRR